MDNTIIINDNDLQEIVMIKITQWNFLIVVLFLIIDRLVVFILNHANSRYNGIILDSDDLRGGELPVILLEEASLYNKI